jgi:nephrocystin-3
MTAPSRLVRVFISSTFRDFIQERDLLVKRVFPELRRRAKERFVEILEVDLRWGITEEQSKSGETLRICLEEIDRCRPSAPVFFVGLLGERYGWIPEQDYFKPDVLEDPKLGWVKEHIVEGKSVTELEILHGVLRNDEMRDKAYFYFRQDGYQQRHWSQIEKHHAATNPPITREDFTNAKSKTPETDEEKQRDLKRRIRDSSLQWDPKDYETPEDLAALVASDLWEAIDRLFPISSVPDALERESLEHRVFMESRTRAYVEREGLFEKLDEFLIPSNQALGQENSVDEAEEEEDESDSAPAPPSVRVVLGESGSGKSALLAAWLKRRDEDVAFFHFVGATPSSVSASSLLRRLLATLRSKGIVPASEAIPHTDEEMAELLPFWLEKLSERGGGIMLFDAVNQLGSARDRELWWWPEKWPENIHVVFSTLPGDSLRAMEKRGWKGEEFVLRIPALQPEEKREMMNRYMKDLFAREMEAHLQQFILNAPQTSNPLFLRTVLDELRLRSAFGTLDKDLDEMLRCADPAELFVHVLKNLERDFTPPEHPELVHRALGLMGVAMRGLSENEILQLLSASPKPAGDPLPRHYWAPLYLALEESLVSREGQLSFFHDYLRSAIWREYLDEEHELESAHARLAETVLRWQEPDAFGQSLKAYGFANGIHHLIAINCNNEATSLLLDENYRETATRTLHDSQPILKDVAYVRNANALADGINLSQAAHLSVLALTGREQLTKHLREALDLAATEADWETVISVISAENNDEVSLLLACRALARNNAGISAKMTLELQPLMEKWATAGKSEWREIIQLIAIQKNE